MTVSFRIRGVGEENLQTERFAADGVQVRKFVELIIRDRGAVNFTRFADLAPKLILRVLTTAEEVQRPSERVRGGIRSRYDESAR